MGGADFQISEEKWKKDGGEGVDIFGFPISRGMKRKSCTQLTGLYRKKSGIYQYRPQVNGKRTAFSLRTKDFEEAIHRALLIKDTTPVQTKDSLLSLVEEFVRFKENKGKFSRFSVSDKYGMLKRFATFCGDNIPVGSMNPKKIGEFFADCENRSLAQSTLSGYKTNIQSFFSWCNEEKRLHVHHFISALKEFEFVSEARTDYIPQSEINRLLNECDDEVVKYVLICGAFLGMRKNEIIESRREWFDFDRQICRVQNCNAKKAQAESLDLFRVKNKKERDVPIIPELQEWLARFVEGKEYCLASGKRRGKSKYRFNYEKRFKTFLKKKGMLHVSSHTLRHSFATNLAIGNVRIEKIASMLGDSIKTTEKHYARFIPDQSSVGILSLGLVTQESPIESDSWSI